jgi:membrane-anchored protein YejM (alkaline phosphatase superfamily)
MIFFPLKYPNSSALHISIHNFPLSEHKKYVIFTFQTWNYHFKLFNILTASKPYYDNQWTSTSSSTSSKRCRVENKFHEITHFCFQYFDVSVVLSFPLLYIVLHHLIFTNVYHCSLYRSSLHVHLEFSDEINYLRLAYSSVSYIFNVFIYSVLLCTEG